MDIISLNRVNNLIWLGRYSERVYTTIKTFFYEYDKMLDDPYFYIQYCERFQIPNIYDNQEDFIEKYILDDSDTNSIISNLYRAYDNCIVLRNEIGTETMTYLEMALNNLKDIKDFDSFILDLQVVIDYILAFWACLSDIVENYEVKTVVKLGRRIERLDLYLRLRKNASNVYLKEIPQIRINETQADNLIDLAKHMNVDYIWIHSASTVLESTLAYTLNDMDTPTLVVEMGVGLRITEDYGNRLVDGILNTMKYLGILTDDVPNVKQPIISLDKNVNFLNAKYAGLFLPSTDHDNFVEKGMLIGQIVNPLNGEILDNIYSPCDGLLFTLREYPLVNEGSLIGRILEYNGKENCL